MASQMTITGEDINSRPVTRPGEVLEAVPGLIVTQHSGEGKANQYFLRGYNLDHGTDIAIFVDDVPINMRTHAHGQGYADLNWLMPETINTVEVRKGPYFADEGDFGSAGNLHIGLIDSVNKTIAQMTVGSFGYERFFGMGSTRLGDGTLLFAGEAGAYNGPWVNPDDMRKISTMLRYTQGTAQDGLSITGMAYSNKWNSTDQVPQRAITSGELGLYGAEDPTDGGNTDRFSLSARMSGTDDAGSWKANAYVVKSDLDLFNNFTYFLSNPVLGDQFHQHDSRVLSGGTASRTLNGTFAGRLMETTFGVQTRNDSIDLGLTDTFQRSFLSNVRSDKVDEASVGVYVENTVHWTDWLRTIVGWRYDYYWANDDSLFDAANSGKVSSGIGSPKFRMVLGPFNKTEFFFGAGYGMHSNDVRGVTITEEPVDRVANPTAASVPLGASPLLVRTKGAEVGTRTKIIPGLEFIGQCVRPRPGLRDRVPGRCGRYRGEPAQPALRSRVDQQVSALFLADIRRRCGVVACPVCRLRCRAGRPLCIACRISAGPDRQRARQLHPQCTVDRGLRRHHHRPEDRLVRNLALALPGCEPAHRRQRVPFASHQHLQRPRGLPV